MNFIFNHHVNAIHYSAAEKHLALTLPIHPFSWHMSLTFDQMCSVQKSHFPVIHTGVVFLHSLHLLLIHNGAVA